MEETIELKQIIGMIKKRLVLILSVTAIVTLIAALYSFFITTPVYESSTQILVSKTEEENVYNINELQTDLKLINTYNVIITSPRILDIVKEELSLSMSSAELKNKIQVRSEADSKVISLIVQDAQHNVAVAIANTTANVFQREIGNLMNVDNVSILSVATTLENPQPVKPNALLNTMIGLVLGVMMGTGLALLLEYFDNTIKTTNDIEQHLQLPVLGSVVNMDDDKTKHINMKRNFMQRSGGTSLG
ncbi:YveK family protein [Longirhabdus pacifica]|uniref:YveK family protein n=1 Tax=Longirhabdus pacifica TaxID=2305227 RepID=UPI001008F0E9|nr:Wzz/FepE/Etk N-terminal domain-containing protein [Longirhabdus pacifica]